MGQGMRQFTRLTSRRVLVAAAVAIATLQVIAQPAAAFEKGFWGPTRTPEGRSAFPIYEKLGVTLYQIQLRWDLVAPTRPERERDPNDPAYQWPSDVSYAIRQAKKHDMKVLLMIIGAPKWAHIYDAAANDPPYWRQAPHPRPYARFARAASRRYPSVRHWMVWGEPDRGNNWQPHSYKKPGEPLDKLSKGAVHRYARMLDAAYGELKRERRKNIVIGGNTFSYGQIRAWQWVRNMRVRGRPPRMDLYGHNPFGARAPDFRKPPSTENGSDFSDLRRFGRHVQRYLGRPRKRRIRLFLSEWTIPTGPNSEWDYYVTGKTQARWIRQGFRLARRERNIVGLGWIHLYDEAPRPDGERRRRGGLIHHDGKRKPGFRAFKRG